MGGARPSGSAHPPHRNELPRNTVMIESIDAEKCIACGLCARLCPLDAIRAGEDGKARIAYPDDCMTCYICERLCPAGAITVHPFREALPPVFPNIPKEMGGGL